MAQDIAIQAAGNYSSNTQIRQPPSHLITIERDGGAEFFIALRHDKAPNYVDATGFFVRSSKKNVNESMVISNYQELIATTLKDSSDAIIEISLPWNRIRMIQSLVYKHKGVKQNG